MGENTNNPQNTQPRFDPFTGKPLNPQPMFDPYTGQPLYPQAPQAPQMPEGPAPVQGVKGLFEAISTCFRKYTDFSGRASRPELWYFFLFYVVVNFLLYAFMVSAADSISNKDFAVYAVEHVGRHYGSEKELFSSYVMDKLGIYFYMIFGFALIMFLPSVAVTVRRLHDTGKSGAVAWVYFIIALINSYISVRAMMAIKAGEHVIAGDSLVDNPAYFVLLNLAQFVLAVCLLFFLTQKGDAYANKYGPQLV